MSLVKFGVMFAMYTQLQTGTEVEIPQPEMPPTSQTGIASWYGNGDWHGTMTANGEDFNPHDFTCAHRTLPFDTVVLIENSTNGRRAWCRINDRGPYGRMDELGEWGVEVSSSAEIRWRGILDMSIATADALGTRAVGLQNVYLRYWPERRRRPLFDLAVWSP